MSDKSGENDWTMQEPDEKAKEKKDDSSKSYRDILLESLKNKAGKNAANWVEKLANDTQQALGRQATLKLPGNFRDLTLQESVTTWMDKMFDHFLDYAYDFNPCVAGTNLEVSWDRPVLFHDVVKERKWSDVETKVWTFKGSLATQAWSLILKGTKNNIQSFIVPKDQTIALSGSQIFFKPYLEMVAVVDRGAVRWTIDEIEMPLDRVDEVAQDLFGALVRVSRGEQEAEEKSHLHGSTHKAPPPIPHQSLTGKYKVFSSSTDLTESMKISFSTDYVPKRTDLQQETGAFRESAAGQSQASEAKAPAESSARADEKKPETAREPEPSKSAPPAEKAASSPAPVEKATGPMPEMDMTMKLPAAAKATGAMPAIEKPTTPTPAAKATGVMPAIEKPTTPTPAAEKATGAMPAVEKPTTPTPAAEKATGVMPAVEKPTTPTPAAEKATGVMPAMEKPTTSSPPGEKLRSAPAVEAPVADSAASEAKGKTPEQVKKGVDLMVDGKEINVSQACDLLVGVIDRDLDMLSKEGADAFTRRDMKAAEEVLKRSSKLNSFREQVSNLMSEWKDQL